MRLARFVLDGRQGIAALDGDTACGRFADEAAYPGELDALLAEGPDILRAAGEALYAGTRIDLSMAQLLSPFCAPGKIICVGLNMPTIRTSQDLLFRSFRRSSPVSPPA
jgi:acylpyruvate hydrolase